MAAKVRSDMMKAMILAAGAGRRMRPWTDYTAKPLLYVRGRRLIEWHLLALSEAGVKEVVINAAHHAEQFAAALGDGSRYGIKIRYSYERQGGLETAAGLAKALPLLGKAPFLVLNGDLWLDVDWRKLTAMQPEYGHLLMVDNPLHHPEGDFGLLPNGRLDLHAERRLTYAGIAVLHPRLLDGVSSESSAPLAPIFRRLICRGHLTGQYHSGRWQDVGTPLRLLQLEA